MSVPVRVRVLLLLLSIVIKRSFNLINHRSSNEHREMVLEDRVRTSSSYFPLSNQHFHDFQPCWVLMTRSRVLVKQKLSSSRCSELRVGGKDLEQSTPIITICRSFMSFVIFLLVLNATSFEAVLAGRQLVSFELLGCESR